MAEALFEIDCGCCDDGVFLIIDDRDISEICGASCLPEEYQKEIEDILQDTTLDDPYKTLIVKFKADKVLRWSTEE